MNVSKTVVGIDTAKQIFQLRWVDRETGEIVSRSLKREKFWNTLPAGRPA